MHVDENEFFRQAAFRICSSLNIGKAMADCLAYIKDYLPAVEMILGQFTPDLAVFRNMACVSVSGKIRTLPPVILPKKRVLETEALFRKKYEVKIQNDLDEDMPKRLLLPYIEVSVPSTMSMALVVEGKRLGVLAIIAEGRGVFRKEHTRLFSLLREPFAIATSNALRYEEVLKLKEMVDVENRELNRELLRSDAEEIVGAEYGLSGVMEMVRQVAP